MYEKKYIQLKKEKLAYIEVGSGDTTIVLIHGNFTSSFSLYPFFAILLTSSITSLLSLLLTFPLANGIMQ